MEFLPLCAVGLRAVHVTSHHQKSHLRADDFFSPRDEPAHKHKLTQNSAKVGKTQVNPRAAAIDGAADRIKQQCEWAAGHYHPLLSSLVDNVHGNLIRRAFTVRIRQ